MKKYKDPFQLTAVFVEEPEGGYSAYIEELQGINTQGETMDEARENLKDALSLFMEVKNFTSIKICRDLDIPAPKKFN